MVPKGAPRRPIWGANGDQRDIKSAKICKKWHLKSGPEKDYEKVTKVDPPDPHKVGFGYRGVSISTNPTNLQKVT